MEGRREGGSISLHNQNGPRRGRGVKNVQKADHMVNDLNLKYQ